MLINCDIKGLEVVVAAELSDDKVLKNEIISGVDTHGDNQKRFSLPDRVTAKRFIFKLLYGATAYGYSVDSDFLGVGYSEKRWQEVIDEFYNKYQGIAKWHTRIILEAKEKGWLSIPSGRSYEFRPKQLARGDLKWPLTQIKNYPVQGFGADLVMLARIEFFRNFMASGLTGYFIQTVHDSLVIDSPLQNVEKIVNLLTDAVDKVPLLCYNNWKYNFTLPLTCEIQVGKNKKELYDYKQWKESL